MFWFYGQVLALFTLVFNALPELRRSLAFYLHIYFCQLTYGTRTNHTWSCDTHPVHKKTLLIHGISWLSGTAKIPSTQFLRLERTHFKDGRWDGEKTNDNLFSQNRFMIILSESLRSKWKCHFPFILLLSGCHRHQHEKPARKKKHIENKCSRSIC